MLFFRDRKRDFSKIKFNDGVVWGDEPFLVLYGEPGAGKTWRALSFLNEWEGWEFASVVELFTEIRKYKSDETIQDILGRVARAPRMIIDDLGFEPDQKFTLFGTEYIPREELKSIIFLRDAERLRTIIATNRSPEMILEDYGERIYDRLIGAATFYCFEGTRRGGEQAIVRKDPVGKPKVKSVVSLYPLGGGPPPPPMTPEEKKKADEELAEAAKKLPYELQWRLTEMIARWRMEPRKRGISTVKDTSSASARSSRKGAGGSAGRRRGRSTRS